MTAFPNLLSPAQIGRIEVRNRVVFTAHGAFLDFYKPSEPPERYVGYQERRAAGGAGLIILQPVHVHPSSHAMGHHTYDPDDLRAKLTLIGERLHAHGAKVLIQLMHFGAEFNTDARLDLQPLWGFSPLTSPTGAEVAHEMTPAEIEEVVDGFARTAAIAIEAGLDGVEVHATHGYLVQQSFSPWGNRRTDEWGEPRRFVTAVLERIRAAVGAQPVVSLRMSVDDFLPEAAGGLGPKGLRGLARSFAETRLLDLVNTSAGARSAHYAKAVASYQHPHGLFLPLDRELRAELAGLVPVIGVGRITTPELAEEAVRDGFCDLVAMTRAQIADPELVRKLQTGERARLRPCVGANQGCVDRMVGALPITLLPQPGRRARASARRARAGVAAAGRAGRRRGTGGDEGRRGRGAARASRGARRARRRAGRAAPPRDHLRPCVRAGRCTRLAARRARAVRRRCPAGRCAGCPRDRRGGAGCGGARDRCGAGAGCAGPRRRLRPGVVDGPGDGGGPLRSPDPGRRPPGHPRGGPGRRTSRRARRPGHDRHALSLLRAQDRLHAAGAASSGGWPTTAAASRSARSSPASPGARSPPRPRTSASASPARSMPWSPASPHALTTTSAPPWRPPACASSSPGTRSPRATRCWPSAKATTPAARCRPMSPAASPRLP